MEYVRAQGYPVPAVEELSDDGCDLVMERIEGRSLADAMLRAPWRLGSYGRELAELHLRLHDIAAPDFLPPAPVGVGSCIVHLDLHPLNVMVGPKGPFVIDWANAARGDAHVDVALAWLLVAGARIPGRILPALVGWARGFVVKPFLASFDLAAILAVAGDTVRWKATDPHMAPEEIASMQRVIDRAEKLAERH